MKIIFFLLKVNLHFFSKRFIQKFSIFFINFLNMFICMFKLFFQ